MTEPRELNELESAKIDIITLKTQLINEQKKSREYQQVIVDLRKEVLDLRAQLQESENDKTLLEMGIIGNNRVVKTDNGKYRVEPLDEAVKN